MPNYGNTASVATLSAPITAGATSCTVNSFTGWPTTSFWAIIARGTASAEIVLCTNVSGSTLTITRGQDGTVASSHGAGDSIEHVVPATHFVGNETHIAASTVHGVSGTVVGTTDAQTLTNKTYQGAHKSVFSDATPAGVTSSFESTADTGAARDGFVHKNTAGSAARRGFLLEQSGTPRFEVFNDGKVKLAPSASPGLENDGTTQLDGALTANSTATLNGATTVNNTLGVTGAATMAGIAASGNVTVGGTLGVTGDTSLGNVTASGTLGVTGTTTAGAINASGAVSAASVAATGAVTGASATVTGDVSARNGKVVTHATGSDFGVRSEIVHNAGTSVRDVRQPMVHRIRDLGLSVALGASDTVLREVTFTPRYDCHPMFSLSCDFLGDEGNSGGVFEPAQATFKVRFKRVSDSIVVFSGEDYWVALWGSDTFNQGGRCTVTASDCPNLVLTGGTQYTVQLYGRKTTTLNPNLKGILGFIQEAVLLD